LERPLSQGVIIHGRYQVLSVLSEGDPDIIYEAEDLLLCWNCGHVNQTADEVYCWDCGAALQKRTTLQLRETPLPEIVEGVEISETGFEEGGYRYEVLMPQVEDQEALLTAFQMSVGFQSDAGKLREVDEDSLLVLQANALCEMQGIPSLGFFAVADGIGGHQAGEIASQTVIRSLAANVLGTLFMPEMSGNDHAQVELTVVLKTAVHSANQDLLAARQTESKDMGCTLTAVLVRDNQAVIINVGDSRTYLMRKGTLSQITEDHSMVAKLLAQGLIQPGEAFTHEQKSVIYRSMGEKGDLELDDATFEISLEPGDRLLLCCDGLWEMVPDRFIEDLLLEYFDPQVACDRLVEMANQAGGEDNISLILLNFQALKRFR
jgi:serine/threonine protein phosphatase PrpC